MVNPSDTSLECVVLGTGNVAYSLVPQLIKAGINVRQIYGRNIAHAQEIANLCKQLIRENKEITVTNSKGNILAQADLYIITVADDAIATICQSVNKHRGLWVHTSGSVPKEILSSVSDTYGVIYPMQTFTKGIPVDLKNVPIFVEGSSEIIENQLINIASRLSEKVKVADSDTRKRIHAAAVFACNFVNYLWINAKEVLETTGNDIEILFPLIQETWDKIHKISPLEAQTGPARRGDRRVIEEHLRLLPENQRVIYEFLSSQIMKLYGKDRLQ